MFWNSENEFSALKRWGKASKGKYIPNGLILFKHFPKHTGVLIKEAAF